jgi:TM2 domain-containing membrane protein YozV
MQGMTEQQRMLFMTSYNAEKKDGTVGVLLGFFLGGLGAHRFYLRQYGLGVLYVLFCWAVIPHLIALVECFFMPGRVRRYNEEQAHILARQVWAMFPDSPQGAAPGPPPTLQRALT